MAPLQRRPTIIEQAKSREFLFESLDRRPVQGVDHFFEKQFGEFLTRAVQNLPDPFGRAATAEPKRQLLSDLGRPRFGVIGAKAEDGVKRLATARVDGL